MNNIELEQKIKQIASIENYFDMIMAIKDFEGEYKTSDFYKKTKKPLEKVLLESKIHYALQLQGLGEKIQNLINNLDLNHLNELLDQTATMFEQENNEIKESLEVIKDLKS